MTQWGNKQTPEERRGDLIMDRLWNCAEARGCNQCELLKRCQRLHDCAARKTLTAEATELFLASFQDLISKSNGNKELVHENSINTA